MHKSHGEIEEEFLLIQKAQKNAQCFKYLYDAYFEPIFRFVYRRIDHEDDTADIVSQTFYVALKNLNKYKSKGVPFSAWLYRIAINEINAFYRRTKKTVTYSLETEIINELFDDFSLNIELEENRIAKTIMGYLDEGDVEILELRFFEQKSFKDISYILEISEAAAKMRAKRAVARLKQIMHEKKKV